jgi:hypothetical protein
MVQAEAEPATMMAALRGLDGSSLTKVRSASNYSIEKVF